MSVKHVEMSYLTRNGTIREYWCENGARVGTIRYSGSIQDFWTQAKRLVVERGLEVLTYVDQHSTEVPDE